MKLIADENFPPTLISYLQKKLHDVKRIQRSARGTSDVSIKEKAIGEKRIILSFDKDFLKTKSEQYQFSAVIFDFPYMKPIEILPYMEHAIYEINNLKKRKKHFIVIYSISGFEDYS